MKHLRTLSIALTLLSTSWTTSTAADELGWSDVAEFSFVLTAGNSETTTFGLKNTLTHKWDNAEFTFNAGGIRAESETLLSRDAIGTVDDFVVSEATEDETTAENYYLNTRYRRDISERLFWFTGAGWERNRFAGIDNRYIGEGGVGNVWLDAEDHKFRTQYGLTYTDEDPLSETTDVDSSFIGARFAWDYLNKIGKNATYTNVLVLDANVEESSDWRGDMINALTVAMTEKLALKLSLQWLYDNEPSFEDIGLNELDATGVLGAVLDATGAQVVVPAQLDELDTLFTASLVVNF